ncbi:MAG: glycosyltransferase family protein [Methylococcaceae bacterium]
MRWFYVPNENTEGDQIGPRMAFEKLHTEGVFSAYMAYSYLVRQQALTNHQDALNEFLETARAFAPDVIFIQHPGNGYPMDRAYLQQLKALPSRPKLVLYEADPYGQLIKRMNSTLCAVIAETDICYLVGTGYLAEIAHKAGAKKVRFAPHSYDSQRFGTPWQPTLTRQFDAVMIANLTCLKRIPWLFLPGGRSRKLTAQALYRQLGDRFALYGAGQGWKGEPYCRGKIAFDNQGEVIRDAWMSVNWGQFDEIAMYASDRLPISLACGVPHITNYQPGYEHVFNNIPGLFIIKSPQEALDVALYILSLTIEQRNEMGFQAAEYARKHLEATVVYTNIVSVINEQLFNNQSPSSQIIP